jgi:hypothetical protein
VFYCVLESVKVVVGPRASNTPVAAWSWPTWVVESKTCVGSHVHLVGASISFEKNCYQLPFTPPSPSLVVVSVLSTLSVFSS